jgi:hypothetical protein
MYSNLESIGSLEDISGCITGSEIYYKITGGLGNQLFGISECHFLHKVTGKKIIIDFADVDHVKSNQVSPFEFDYDWMRMVICNFKPDAQNVKLLNLASSDVSPSHAFYTGWRPSMRALLESNFFQRGVLPKEWEQRRRGQQKPYIAAHLRFGDYLNVPALGGDISVDARYLKKALNLVTRELDVSRVLVFSDDMKRSEILCDDIDGIDFVFSESLEPVEDLIEMCASDAIIASGSTYSFWAAFFAKTDKVFFPKPFFPTNPRWEADLLGEPWRQVRRTRKLEKLFFGALGKLNTKHSSKEK